MLAMRRQRVVLRQWAVCVRRTARLRRLLLRGDKNCLREGITAWYEWVQRRFMNAHRIAVAASRWQYHTVTACLLAWEFEARATRQRHRTGWKVLQRWLRLVARDVLATWREAVRLAQLQRVESREKMRTTKLDLDQEQQTTQGELAASWASGQRWVSNQLAVESLGRLDTTLRTLRRAPAVMHFDQEQILGKGSRLSALTAIDEAIEALASLLPLILAGGDPVAAAAAAAAAAAEEGIPPYYSPRIADMSSRSRSVWLEVASPQPEEAESPEPQISEIVTPPSSASKSSSSSHSRGRSSRKKKRGGGGSSKNPKSATPSLAARESPGGDAVPGGGVGSMAAGAASTGRGATARRWKALARWEAEHRGSGSHGGGEDNGSFASPVRRIASSIRPRQLDSTMLGELRFYGPDCVEPIEVQASSRNCQLQLSAAAYSSLVVVSELALLAQGSIDDSDDDGDGDDDDDDDDDDDKCYLTVPDISYLTKCLALAH